MNEQQAAQEQCQHPFELLSFYLEQAPNYTGHVLKFACRNCAQVWREGTVLNQQSTALAIAEKALEEMPKRVRSMQEVEGIAGIRPVNTLEGVCQIVESLSVIAHDEIKKLEGKAS